MNYLIIIEETTHGYSAFSPDIPGCVSTGKTKNAVEKNIAEAIQFHLDGLRKEGYKIPLPHTYATNIKISA